MAHQPAQSPGGSSRPPLYRPRVGSSPRSPHATSPRQRAQGTGGSPSRAGQPMVSARGASRSLAPTLDQALSGRVLSSGQLPVRSPGARPSPRRSTGSRTRMSGGSSSDVIQSAPLSPPHGFKLKRQSRGGQLPITVMAGVEAGDATQPSRVLNPRVSIVETPFDMSVVAATSPFKRKDRPSAPVLGAAASSGKMEGWSSSDESDGSSGDDRSSSRSPAKRRAVGLGRSPSRQPGFPVNVTSPGKRVIAYKMPDDKFIQDLENFPANLASCIVFQVPTGINGLERKARRMVSEIMSALGYTHSYVYEGREHKNEHPVTHQAHVLALERQMGPLAGGDDHPQKALSNATSLQHRIREINGFLLEIDRLKENQPPRLTITDPRQWQNMVKLLSTTQKTLGEHLFHIQEELLLLPPARLAQLRQNVGSADTILSASIPNPRTPGRPARLAQVYGASPAKTPGARAKHHHSDRAQRLREARARMKKKK